MSSDIVPRTPLTGERIAAAKETGRIHVSSAEVIRSMKIEKKHVILPQWGARRSAD